MTNKCYLVTGAAGYVGSHLTKLLVQSGCQVKALVRKPSQEQMVASWGAQPILGDITDPDSLRKAVYNVDGIFHIAAIFRQAGVPDSEYFKVNVDGTRNLLDAAVNAKVKRFIHCSTVGVHGHIDNPPADELTPFNPGDPYQESKCLGEHLVRSYFEQNKISGVIIRPAMIYGPHDSRILKLFRMIASGSFFYVGNGDGLVHFIDVRDLVRAFADSMRETRLNNEAYIIAGETSLPLHSLVSIISSMLGVREPRIKLPIKPVQLIGSICEALCVPFNINPPIYRRRVDFFTKDRSFDCSKARKDLLFKPRQSLALELLDIINSYVSSGGIRLSPSGMPSLMLRDLNGEISYWNDNATEMYGWSREQAVGQISHSLLNTTFPENLERINEGLYNNRRWQGLLHHSTMNRNQIQVASRWFLVGNNTSDDRYVIEVNRDIKVAPPPGKNILNRITASSFSANLMEVLPQINCGTGLCYGI